jgi:hypothetical protein
LDARIRADFVPGRLVEQDAVEEIAGITLHETRRRGEFVGRVPDAFSIVVALVRCHGGVAGVNTNGQYNGERSQS